MKYSSSDNINLTETKVTEVSILFVHIIKRNIESSSHVELYCFLKNHTVAITLPAVSKTNWLFLKVVITMLPPPNRDACSRLQGSYN